MVANTANEREYLGSIAMLHMWGFTSPSMPFAPNPSLKRTRRRKVAPQPPFCCKLTADASCIRGYDGTASR